MGATTVTTRAIKGSALTHNEMDANFTNLNAVGMYVGSIVLWPTATVPDSTFLELAGQSVAVASYPDLHAVIGYTYGGSGANMNLPDYRGLVPRGWNHGSGVDPDAASRTNRGDGTTGDVVGSKQADELKAHTHTENTSANSNNTPSGYITSANSGGINVNTGSTGGLETRMKNINAMYIIKAKKS